MTSKETNAHPGDLGSWPWDHPSAILSPAARAGSYVTEAPHGRVCRCGPMGLPSSLRVRAVCVLS